MKLPATDSGQFNALPLCSIPDAEDEMKAARDSWEKSTDDMNPYSTVVAVEKLLGYVLPVSECVEHLCLEFFGDDDYKSVGWRGEMTCRVVGGQVDRAVRDADNDGRGGGAEESDGE